MSEDPRDYGFGDPTPYLNGKPVVGSRVDGAECPHCKCEMIFSITIPIVDHPLLKTKHGEGRYVGCPACPWASPMIITVFR